MPELIVTAADLEWAEAKLTLVPLRKPPDLTALRIALMDGGPCVHCKHPDGRHHSSASPRWCGECHCPAYAASDVLYNHALTLLRRSTWRVRGADR